MCWKYKTPRPYVKHFKEKVKRVSALARVDASSTSTCSPPPTENVIWTRGVFNGHHILGSSRTPCCLVPCSRQSRLWILTQLDTMLWSYWTCNLPLVAFTLLKPEVNTAPLRYYTLPVLTLLLDQNAGRTPPVLSKVVNPEIKCRSMDTTMQLASFGDSTGSGGGGGGGGGGHWHVRVVR